MHLSRADLVCGWLAKLLCLATIVAGSSAHANNCTQFGAVNETLTRGNGHLHLNLFFSELPPSGGPKEPIALLRKVVERSASQFAFVATPEKKSPAGPWYYAKVVQDASKLPRMSMEYLQFKGRTLTEPQKLAASSPKALLLVGFVIPEKDFAKNFRAANEVGEAVARATGTLLSDDDTRDVYAPDTWRAARLKGAGSALTVGDHLAIHLYRKGEHLRAVTLGMSKFGLPELAIDEMAGGENWPAGTLLNVLSQRLYESPATVTMGRFNLSLSDLQSSPWRTEIQSSLVAPAKGEGELCLYDAKPEPGDADNRLLRLGFELSAGSDRHSQRNAFLGSWFGVRNSTVLNARANDAELLEASKRARAKMPQLKATFLAGLRPGERLLVKSPFSAEGGTEYMWIEVTRWDDRGIAGLLMGEPRAVKSLRSGQAVVIRESDFYDYVLERPGGESEGNETGKLLEARAKR